MNAIETLGISPKVYVPVIGQAVAGVALILLGLDVEGKTALGTAIATFGLGFQASPGDVAAAGSDLPDDEAVEGEPV